MQEQWAELIESLDDSVDALTLEQIKNIVEFFESGISGYLAATLIKGDFDHRNFSPFEEAFM
jgi:hypothetical protein